MSSFLPWVVIILMAFVAVGGAVLIERLQNRRSTPPAE